MEQRQRPPSSLSSAASALAEMKRRDEGRHENVHLKKKVGLVSGIALIVGTMIGSGIFISPKGVAEGGGSVGFTIIIWLICGIISLCGAMAYAELGTMINKSGAEYSYLLEAFGPLHSSIGGIPAFLMVWTNTMLLKPASVAIIMLTFAAYATAPFYDSCSASVGAQKCLAALGIIILTMVNCLSVRLATGLQNVLTVAKLVAVVIIVIAGFVKLGQGSTAYLARGFAETKGNIGQIAIGLYKGMWAYDGWNNLNFVTEELSNPFVNLPRAVMIGVPLVTVCYLLINISYFTVMSVPELIESPAVAVTWAAHVFPTAKWVVPLFVALSLLGSLNGCHFSAGRLSYVAAREGHMIELLSMIHVRKFTPMPSLILTALLSLLYVIPGDVSSLIDFFNFAVWFFYGGTMAALLVLRYTEPNLARPFKVPIVIPIFVLVVAILLVIVPIAATPSIGFLFAFLFIISGFIFYIPFVHFEKYPAFMEPFTAFFQLLMEVTPASGDQMHTSAAF